METTDKTQSGALERLFKVGAHFGLVRSRRHPSVRNYIFGVKNRVEIFDLEKTSAALEAAKQFVEGIARERGTVLFVGGKSEAREAVKSGAEEIDMPFVAGRWLGGTLTNFSEIKKRINRLATLSTQREKGELTKYTKKERLLIDREIEYLNRFFSGLSTLERLPKALFVVDSRREHIAVREANNLGIPVIALCSSDCDISIVQYPIPGNDASVASIKHFVDEIVASYKEGLKSAPVPKAKEEAERKVS